jgi:uncharacterized MAPEG superfamily protein
MTHLPALAALLALLVFFWCVGAVGRARGRYSIHAPATTGNPDFERVFRVQMNTLEALAMFLPALWIAARYGNPTWAGGIGLLWVAGRVWYALAYFQAAAKRGPGFVIGCAATIALWLMGSVGVVKAMLAG